MITNIVKTTNLITINTGEDVEVIANTLPKCYSLNSGYKFAPKHSVLDTDLATDAIIFTIGGESFDIICANGIILGDVGGINTLYTTLEDAYPALIDYLA